MKSNSVLKIKHVVWATVVAVLLLLLFFVTRSPARPTAKVSRPLPVVEVAPV